MSETIIEMAGIDHRTAPLEIRERFSFTKVAAQATMREVVAENGVTGCVILSTCNRTELWMTRDEDCRANALRLLCSARKVLPEECEGRVTRRVSHAAHQHLFETACGLHSRVFGEDQIISQVAQSITLARECGCANAVLEQLFKTAVTAAKRVKTTVRLAAGDASAPARAISIAEHELGGVGALNGVECLVIGNGEMGRIAAHELILRGCRVQITLRSYKRGAVQVPFGCTIVPYEQRYQALKTARIVISATSSPHHTLHYDEARPYLSGEQRLLIDLAVPRDISVRLGAEQNITLYDIDSLAEPSEALHSSAGAERLSKAHVILEEALDEFAAWLAFRGLWPLAQNVGSAVAEDVSLRLAHTLAHLLPNKMLCAQVEVAVRNATEKVAEKLVYGLRGLPEEAMARMCMEQLVQAAQKLPAQYAHRTIKGEKME